MSYTEQFTSLPFAPTANIEFLGGPDEETVCLFFSSYKWQGNKSYYVFQQTMFLLHPQTLTYNTIPCWETINTAQYLLPESRATQKEEPGHYKPSLTCNSFALYSHKGMEW